MSNSRRLITMLLAVLALLGVSAAVSVARAPAGLGSHASATLSACTTSAGEGTATFSAQMEALPGTRLMAVSFDLYRRTSAGEYMAVSAPGFGTWQLSNRGIASFTANENVVDLPVPGAFRALVHFRWLGRRARVIRRNELLTPVCSITTPQPDLSITKITHGPGVPARTTELFNVTVRNRGGAAAGGFAVALMDGGTALAEQTVPSLAPATSTTVQFSGPRCTAGQTLIVQVDPAGAVSEPADPTRTVTIDCTAPAAGATGSA